MKVLALTEAPNHVCYRYRIEAFAPALNARGWTLESLPLEPNTFHRSSQLRAASGADVVILQRRLLPLWQLRILRKASKVFVYDFDDALFHRDSYSRKGPLSWTRLAHFWATVYFADAVTAGNRYLAEQAAAYVQPQRVHRIPTCVDPAMYRPATHYRRGADAKLVWIGQHSTLNCLNLAEPFLAAAGERLPGLQLRVICNRFPQLGGITVMPRQWSMATEAAEVADADIGISWLPDDPWSLGKCGLKVLQYMAAGLPVVANPVGMNCEMVVPGETGFLASTPDEWAEAIHALAADPAMRARLGRGGRELVEEQYGVSHWSRRFAELIDSLPRQGAAALATDGAAGVMPDSAAGDVQSGPLFDPPPALVP
ncbi:MAG: glycosyltransferase family 4 protein [Planctomycetia bacterium]|nr:glycosyltransferase family 4 protein [Planctomycetia bacterium]